MMFSLLFQELVSQLESTASLNTSLHSKIEQLTIDRDATQAELQSKINHVVSLEEDRDEKEEELRKRNNTIVSLQEEMLLVKKAASEMEEWELKSSREELSDAQNRLVDVEGELERLRKELSESQEVKETVVKLRDETESKQQEQQEQYSWLRIGHMRIDMI